jgi:hypothetical protein
MSWVQIVALQLLAALAGIGAERLARGRSIAARPPVAGRRRLLGAGGLLAALALWFAACVAVKLLTWKPFAGDAPGSVEATNALLLAGSAVLGFVAARWTLRAPRDRP